MPHVLIVSHNFPPILGPESVLVRMWALALLRSGWRVTVLTTTERHWNLKSDPELLNNLPPELEILRAPSPEAWLNRFPRLGAALFRCLAACGLAEWHLAWKFTAMWTVRRWLRNNHPDVIYSRQPKQVSGLVAMQIKHETGIRWVAHWSDMWASSPYRYRHTQLQWQAIDRLEAEEMREADAVIFVAKRAAEQSMQRYDEAVRSKLEIIRHGYATYQGSSPNMLRSGGGQLKMVHAGAFYPNISDPKGLFEALAVIHRERSLRDRFALHCVGPDTIEFQPLIDQLGLAEIVTLQSILPFGEAQSLVASADILLVVPYHCTALPTKLFEYMAFKKPMLGLTPEDSDTADVMKHCGMPVVQADDVPGIAMAMRDFLRRWESREWGLNAPSLEALDSYHVDRLVGSLTQVLRQR